MFFKSFEIINCLVLFHLRFGYSILFNAFDGVQKFTIEENQPIKTFVGRIKLNKLIDEELTYSFGILTDQFIIDPKSGDIHTSKIIDLETLCANNCAEKESATISLNVNVNKFKTLISVVKIVITVIDIDDNKPEFERSDYVMDIKEVINRKNMAIFLPPAIDKDISLKNREITYRISGDHSAFALEEHNSRGPKLRLLIDIDYEKQKSYRFTLSAYQKTDESMSTNLNVTLNVININDCAPEFSKSFFEVSVSEDVNLDESIIKISATDADGDNLKYILFPTTNYFQINNDGDLQIIQKLDYEKHQSFSFTIQASDGEFIAESKLKITVLDVNDEPPSYILNPEKLVIDETNKSGILVGQITIFDRDSVSVNRGVKCTETNLESQALRLEKDQISTDSLLIYKLYTVHALDREQLKDGIIYTSFICYDSGIKRQLYTNISIPLYVQDINDNEPVFPSLQYQVGVKENNDIGYRIFQAQATDDDIGKNALITYNIQFSMDSDIFIIDPQSGWIKLMQSLDREKKNQYVLTVIAVDQGLQDRKSGSTQLTITVLDDNDNIPELRDYTEFSIMENLPIGHYIGTLIGYDKDEGDNAKVNFKISVEHNYQPLTINQTGSLFSNQVFDREKKNKVCTRIQLSDSAIVNVLTSQVSVCVNILDENDNYPQIFLYERDESTPISSLYNNSYNEHTNVDYVLKMSIREKVGFVLAVVKATDNDAGNVSQLSYYIENIASENMQQTIFEIDLRSGKIIVNRPLHRDLLGLQKIKVMVEDSGQPSLKSAKNIIIEILDIPQSSEKPSNVSNNPHLIGNNFMISLILSVVSALLILILISVIICIVKPCTSRDRFHNQTYEGNFVPSLMFQDQVRHLSPDLGEKQNFEISGNMEGIWGGNTIKRQTLLSNNGQNWNNSRSFGPSNDLYLDSMQKSLQNSEFTPTPQYMTTYNGHNALTLLIRNDEQRSDSGKGASDDDMSYVPRFISDPVTINRNGYSTYNPNNAMQILPFPGCVFNCSNATYTPVSTTLHQATTDCSYLPNTYPSISTHESTNI